MTDPLSEVFIRLRNRGIEPRQSGSGWSCRCPAHDDRSPSLSINRGDDGRVLVHCHAGCRFTDITTALGLMPRDLFPANADVASSWAARRVKPRAVPKAPDSPSLAVTGSFATWMGALGIPFRTPTATWLYRDASGHEVGAVARFSCGGRGKTFRQASLSSDGRWIAKGMPAPRPLYRLPMLLASHGTVYVVEGEKCADAVGDLGLMATTSIGGANNPHHTDWTPLAGRRVVIVPDADEQGRNYATQVAALARKARAADIRLVDIATLWPAVPPKGDIADWILTQPPESRTDLAAMLEQQASHALPVSPCQPLPAVTSRRRLRSKRPPRSSTRQRGMAARTRAHDLL